MLLWEDELYLFRILNKIKAFENLEDWEGIANDMMDEDVQVQFDELMSLELDEN